MTIATIVRPSETAALYPLKPEALEQRARPDYSIAFRRYLSQGIAGLGGDHGQLARVPVDIRGLGTSQSTAGGYLVPEQTERAVWQAMDSFSVVRRAATTRRTATGGGMIWPTIDEASIEGRQVDESGSVTETTPAFGGVSIPTFLFTSDLVKVSWQLLADSGPDVEAFLLSLLARRTARALNRALTVGAGANSPQGIVRAARGGITGGAGQTTTVTSAQLLALQDEVTSVYRSAPGAAYMMSPTTLSTVKQLTDAASRPLVESARENGQRVEVIDGFKVLPNPHMADMAAGARSVLFGDLSQFLARDVEGAILLRLDELYAGNMQSGFLWFSRHGAAYTNAAV